MFLRQSVVVDPRCQLSKAGAVEFEMHTLLSALIAARDASLELRR